MRLTIILAGSSAFLNHDREAVFSLPRLLSGQRASYVKLLRCAWRSLLSAAWCPPPWFLLNPAPTKKAFLSQSGGDREMRNLPHSRPARQHAVPTNVELGAVDPKDVAWSLEVFYSTPGSSTDFVGK